MMQEYLKHRIITDSYCVKEPMQISELRTILNNLPDDFSMVTVEEILRKETHSSNKNFITTTHYHETPISTYLPIFEIVVDNENKEVLFYTKKANDETIS